MKTEKNTIALTRKGFLAGLLSSGAAAGCRSVPWIGGPAPRLRLGVVSDTHITTQESTEMFRRSLAYFRKRGADAVLVAGDLTDWGLLSSLRFVKEAWDDEMGGTGIVPLFVTGNHDFDGWWYGDMTLDMHIQGFSEDEALVGRGMKGCWEEVFGEPYDAVRRRTVKGFDFVSAEWGPGAESNKAQTVAWLSAHAGGFPKDRPVFFMRHAPLPETVSSSPRNSRDPVVTEALKGLPNCFAFTGHTHWTLNDERSIWQDSGLTAISVPSLSYTSIPRGYENGYEKRDGKCAHGMGIIPSRLNLIEAQGFFVSVYDGETVVERYDFEECEEAADPWVVPMPPAAGRPYAFSEHAKRVPVPEFPGGAAVKTRIENSDRRNGTWTIFVALEFPAARASGGGRVFDYEVRAVSENGAPAVSKKFLSPAFYRLARHEPETMRFRFDAMDLPESGRYRFEVVARNCFGAESAPLYSRYFQSVPGKDKAKRIAGRGG